VSFVVHLHPLDSFLSVSVKHGDAEVVEYHETYSAGHNHYTKVEYYPYTKPYKEYLAYKQEYKPEHTQKYGYDCDQCQLPPKEMPWYNDYYKWACEYYPFARSVPTFTVHSIDDYYPWEKPSEYKKQYDYKKGYDYKPDYEYEKENGYQDDYKSD
jgi:hypothetical protein